MTTSETLKQLTLGAMLTVALAFLIVHPGMYSTVQAHVDPETGVGEPMTASYAWMWRGSHHATYFSSDCRGRHEHRTNWIVSHLELFREMRRNKEHGYKEIKKGALNQGTPPGAIADGLVQIGRCEDMCYTYWDHWYDCMALATGLDKAAAAAAVYSGAAAISGAGAAVSAILAAAGIVSLFAAWLVKRRCRKNKPNEGQCPLITYSS